MARKPKTPDVMLENRQHEMFARCVAAGNNPFACYFGVGYPRDREAAAELVRMPAIRERCEVIHSKIKPHAHYRYGYKHPV